MSNRLNIAVHETKKREDLDYFDKVKGIEAEAKEIIDRLGLKNVYIYSDGIEDNDGRFLILPGEKEFVGCVYPNDTTAHRDYDVIFKYTDYKDLKNLINVWLRARPFNWND